MLVGNLLAFLTAKSQTWAAKEHMGNWFEIFATVVTLGSHLANIDPNWA